MQYDKNFLLQLDQCQEKDIYARIISLDVNNSPIESIEGKVTSGSINVDGSSAMRRTCSLSLVAAAEDTIVTDSYWCFNTKMKLQIGLKNTINKKYPDIIWFDQGVYIITSFSVNKTTTNLTINLQGKDKMCRLNGDIGGNLLAQTDFGKIEVLQEDSDDILIEKVIIKDIIYNAIKTYGQEADENIIINDLDDYGYELWEYLGEDPMYYLKSVSTGEIEQLIIDSTVNINYNGNSFPISDLEIQGGQYYSTNTIDTNYNIYATPITLYDSTEEYYVIRIDAYSTAGYKAIKLVYNTELILNIGETITGLLDKLTGMLGNFEYFYDLQGRFVFQKKKDYIQELWSTSTGALTTPILLSDYYSYEFNDEKLISNVSISPNILNVKNDFSVWGNRTTATSQSLPIHARCAIDTKPLSYTTPWPEEREDDGIYYSTNIYYILQDKENNFLYDKQGLNLAVLDKNSYDWRELIYQMSKDYKKHNGEVDFYNKIEQYNPQYINGITKYEQYYTDLNAFWRQLYCPFNNEKIDGEDYYQKDFKYWNKKIHLDPGSLNFWFDFIDTQGELGNYSVNKIGQRTKVINESAVSSIYYQSTPEVQFIESNETSTATNSYTAIQINAENTKLFEKSSQGNSAISKINELIQTHTAIAQGLSLTCIPIFYLQPNTRIKISNTEYNGDYIIDKISYNLNYNGTMSITANRIFKYFI